MKPIPSTQAAPFGTRWQSGRDRIQSLSSPDTGVVDTNHRHIAWMERRQVRGVRDGECRSAELAIVRLVAKGQIDM